MDLLHFDNNIYVIINQCQNPLNIYIKKNKKILIFNDDDNEILNNNKNICYQISNNKFIEELYLAYSIKNDFLKSVMNQLYIDLPRMKYMINNEYVTNYTQLIMYSSKFRNIYHHKFENYANLLLLTLTQASFSDALIVLHQYYTKPIHNLNIISDSDKPIIHIKESSEGVNILFIKNFILIDHNGFVPKTINNFETITEFNFINY